MALTNSFEDQLPVTEIVHGLAHEFKELWWSCDSSLPAFGTAYSKKEKSIQERHLSRTIDSLLIELENLSKTLIKRQEIEERLLVLLSDFAKTAFGVEDRHIAAVVTTGILDATREFIRQAREFDPQVTPSDIYQASRNAWTMNLLQLLFGVPVEVTPAVVGYSLLYPYTDNYLDNTSITLEVKNAFNHRFYERLQGEYVKPANLHEQKIFDLVGLIEKQYDRSLSPQVYDSLLAIYHAQVKSMLLINPRISPYEMDILGIVFEKGGASVLADGCLVAGNLTAIQQKFTFHYGSFTQLMDDLEDVESDHRLGIMTLFSQTARHWPLDAVTNQAFRYGIKMLDRLDDFNTPNNEPLWELFRMAITPLMIDSISQAGSYFSPPYLKQLEGYFPFHFRYLKKQRKRINRRIGGNRLLLEKLMQVMV